MPFSRENSAGGVATSSRNNKASEERTQRRACDSVRSIHGSVFRPRQKTDAICVGVDGGKPLVGVKYTLRSCKKLAESAFSNPFLVEFQSLRYRHRLSQGRLPFVVSIRFRLRSFLGIFCAARRLSSPQRARKPRELASFSRAKSKLVVPDKRLAPRLVAARC